MNNIVATPGRASQAVREALAKGITKDLTVLLRDGRYELAEPWTFGPADSATAGRTITYAAWPGETPILSGGQRITGWKQDAPGQWSATVPVTVANGAWHFQQIFVDGRRAQRARWPADLGELKVREIAKDATIITLNKDPGTDLAGQEAELVVIQNWSITRSRILSNQGPVLTLATSSGWMGHHETATSRGKTCFIEHAKAFLDQPDEWFLDRQAGRVHLRLEPGRDPNAMLVMAPRLTRTLAVDGETGKPVRGLCFRGLHLEGAAFPLPDIGYPEIQAGHYGASMKTISRVVPGLVELRRTEDCRFQSCAFVRADGAGLVMGAGCRNLTVEGWLISDLGCNGVMIGWREGATLSTSAHGHNLLDSDWAVPTDTPTGNRVANCLIERCGQVGWGGVGIWVAFSQDTALCHNLVRDLPYTGISIGFRWNKNPTSMKNCLVEGNHIHNVMKILSDGGGIYTLGFQPGTILRGNFIHDVHRNPLIKGSPNNGFFIDEGSNGFFFEANTVRNAHGGPLRFNNCKRNDHTWKDNAFQPTEANPQAAAWEAKAGPEAAFATRWPFAPAR